MNKLQCELCGSNDFTQDSGGFFVCDYCRTKYSRDKAKSMLTESTVKIDKSDEASNILKLASNAAESGNHREAYDYANQYLEIDIENPTAWYLKGAAAGALSTLDDLRLLEMVNAFNRSIELASPDDKEDAAIACATVLNNVCGILASAATAVSHTDSNPVHWAEHCAKCSVLVESFFKAYEMSKDMAPLENALALANYVKNGFYFYTLPPEVKSGWREAGENIAHHMLELDPSAKPSQSKSGCYVITATMGDEQAVPVVVLREFRDQLLVKSLLGQKAICLYDRIGPRLAGQIRRHRALRWTSLLFIVYPATFMAKCLMGLESLRKA